MRQRELLARGFVMVVICAGMYRSGSTWQYLVAGELLGRTGRRVDRLGFLEGTALSDRVAAGFDPGSESVFKTHSADPVVEPLVAAGAVVLYSYRDLRDVAYSMAHKMNAGFREAVAEFRVIERCLESDRFWSEQPRALVQRYEDLHRDPTAAVAQIARRLGVPLTSGEAVEIADRFSLERNRERTDQFADGLSRSGLDLSDRANAYRYDPATLLHWNHLRDGRVGGWRNRATPEERNVLAQKCGPWLVQRGYEPDQAWAA